MKTSEEKIFKMFEFQYKPLEAKLKEVLKNDKRTWETYQKSSINKKIAVLDMLAGQLGL